jgi:hypothetical protein
MFSLRRRPVQTCDGLRSCTRCWMKESQNCKDDSFRPLVLTRRVPVRGARQLQQLVPMTAIVRFCEENKINKLRRTLFYTHTV